MDSGIPEREDKKNKVKRIGKEMIPENFPVNLKRSMLHHFEMSETVDKHPRGIKTGSVQKNRYCNGPGLLSRNIQCQKTKEIKLQFISLLNGNNF